MAALKAMTYSINDPAKEILYMPTTTIIKVKAKFWIDVVGARCAKAIGSSVTNYAGNADRLVKVGGVPSVLSSLALLYISVRAGRKFEALIANGQIVGEHDKNDDNRYNLVPNREEGDDNIVSLFGGEYDRRGIWIGEQNGEDKSCGTGWKSNTTIELVNTRK